MYGSIYRLSNFIERTIPNRGHGEYSSLFTKVVIDFLQKLDQVQQRNMWVALTIHNNDGIWISYKGMRICFVKPGQNFLTLLSGNWSAIASRVVSLADAKNRYFKDTTTTSQYRTWKMDAGGIHRLLNIIEKLPGPSLAEQLFSIRHPRNFSPEIRNLAYEQFQRGGSICPGAAGRPKHKVNLFRERIEYDHILPSSLGGSSGENNVRVLCMECNRAKAAKAL
jgi:hypothetical protein